MLGVDVAVGAGARLERHGADGALVEDLAVRRLDVGLDGVHAAKDDRAARAPGRKWGELVGQARPRDPPTLLGAGQSPVRSPGGGQVWGAQDAAQPYL